MYVFIATFVLAVISMRIVRSFGVPKWQVSLGLVALGIVLYVANALLMHHFIKKRAPDFASDEEDGTGVLAWELTAGRGVVPKWVSLLGLVGVSAFITAILPWIIALFT